MEAPRAPLRPVLALALAAVLLPLPGHPGSEAPARRGAKDSPSRDAGAVEIAPRSGAKPIVLEAGEVHLLVVLQALADVTGKTVVWSGDVPLDDAVIDLARAIPTPGRPALEAALKAAGYTVSAEELRGREILLVLKELRPSRKPGTIRRVGEAPEPGAAAAGPAEPARKAAGEGGGSGVRLFRQGDGARATYLLLFETSSKAEAEEAQSILRSLLESKRGAGRSR
jgi:hypothetical protein